MAAEVFMPKMSDHMEAGIIVSWLMAEGARVEKGQPIVELETDKATAELEAPESGFLKGIRPGVVAGASVPVGETIAYIAAAPDEPVPKLLPLGGGPAGGAQAEPQAGSQAGPAASAAAGEGGPVRAAPAVRRIARELGVDLAQVPGSGPEGRVTEADVRRFVEARQRPGPAAPAGLPVQPVSASPVQPVSASPAQPVSASPAQPVSASPVARRMAQDLGVDLAQVKPGPGRITKEDVRAFVDAAGPASPPAAPAEGDGEWLELSRAQLLTGQRMVESVRTAPQFALTTRVDMTRALELRSAVLAAIEAETGARLSITCILVKVVAAALKRFPRANASFVDGRIRLHPEVNIGVAIGAEAGLVVPVIRAADQKSLAEITAELNGFQEQASRMRFTPAELSGGTFTISNLGMFGIDHFHAILNPPETAILAVGRIVKTPVGMPDDTIALRPMMNLTLSIDHRSLDGMQGARFLALVAERLEQPYLIL